MRVLWERGASSVDQVRSALPAQHRGAYTTIQTILNRLAERGLLTRKRQGKALIYAPRIAEAEYLTSSLHRALAGASQEARRAALVGLVGDLDPRELDDIRELADEVRSRRAR